MGEIEGSCIFNVHQFFNLWPKLKVTQDSETVVFFMFTSHSKGSDVFLGHGFIEQKLCIFTQNDE